MREICAQVSYKMAASLQNVFSEGICLQTEVISGVQLLVHVRLLSQGIYRSFSGPLIAIIMVTSSEGESSKVLTFWGKKYCGLKEFLCQWKATVLPLRSALAGAISLKQATATIKI